MNTLQKLRITFHIAMNKKRNTMPKKKIELWERDLSAWKKLKINAGIKWRRFDTQLKGMGLFFMLMCGAVGLLTIAPMIGDAIYKNMELQKFKTALNTACTDMNFYSWNYRDCEEIGVRP